MTNADLLIALGVRFDDRVTGRLAAFAPHAKVIHVDIDPGRNRQEPHAGHPHRGRREARAAEAEQAAGRAASRDAQRRTPTPRTAWWQQIREWKDEHPLDCRDLRRPKSSRST